jgi:D-alanine--poly(phosphoribitol) ligase subunit 2
MKASSGSIRVGDSAAVANRILDRVAQICGTNEVRTSPDLALFDRQILDSMKTVELILAIEQDLGLYISPAELDREAWATPSKIIDDIQNRLKS